MSRALIISAVLGRLDEQLRRKPCSAAGSGLRVFCKAANILTYPDVTRNYDRSEKFRFYRGLPSFAECLLLASDSIRAEHFTKQPDNSWLLREYTAPDTTSTPSTSRSDCEAGASACLD